jgi:hypothetical protein
MLKLDVPLPLSAVDAAEIVDLHGVWADRDAESMDAAAANAGVRVVGNDAMRIARLWRSLTAGEPARCHVPPFGLRFWAAGELVCHASICWRCNNVFGRTGDEQFTFAFDATAAPARELLAACEAATGRKAEG